MDEHTYNTLEYNRVLQYLAKFCLSEAGKEAALLLRPLDIVESIKQQQILFEEALSWKAEGSFKMQAFPDLSGVMSFLQGSDPLLDEDGLWGVREALSLAWQAFLAVQEGESRRPALAAMAASLPFPEQSLAGLKRCIANDATLKDESSPGLMLVRGEIRSLHQGCLRKVKEYAEKYNIGAYLQGEYMTLSSDRYVLPLKTNFKGRLQGVIHDYSRTGETVYFEPLFLVEQNNRLQELKQEEREEERKVLKFLTSLLLQELPGMQNAWNFLVGCDVLFAKCELAGVIDGRMVPIEINTPPQLLDARHPLLVLDSLNDRMQTKTSAKAGARPTASRPSKVQPVDILFRENDHVLVISGGNAGGKTVALKTLGLIALMTLAGLPVPAAIGSVLPPWSYIHAFIGDEQSLEDNVSTFTGQIRHLADIWDTLDASTLILLDEFGAGTDPSQGAALAQAVLDGLLEKKTFAVTATHFPALKTYALTHEGVRAASVVFDPVNKKPLYHLAYDQVGASQALDVAREHGLPEDVLRRAEQYLLIDGEDSGAVMDKLNALAAQRENELAHLRQEKLRTREKRLQLQTRLDEERRRLQEDLRQKSQELMHAWKSDRATARQAMKEMAKLRESIRPVEEEQAGSSSPQCAPEHFHPGDTVRHLPWDKQAKVLEVDARNSRVKIDLNGVSLWAQCTDLEPPSKTPVTLAMQNQKKGGVIVNRTTSPSSFLRLDLRGKRADLAMAELERFIDQSILTNTEGVEIIHGRGTGALRKAVHEYLKKHPGIADFQLAPEDQGGDGMTMVQFR